jgi:uncharacterized membrane protein YfcA
MMTEDEFVIESRKWKHRRRMAYIALLALLGILVSTFFVILTPTQAGIIEWGLILLGGIVGAYMGAATFEHLGRK